MAKKQYPDRLPRVPSELIRLGLKDLAKVEADRNVRVDMRDWVGFTGSDVCTTCFAGAVMAGKLGSITRRAHLAFIGSEDYYGPVSVLPGDLEISLNDRRALDTLNWIRIGMISTGVAHMRPGMSRTQRTAIRKLHTILSSPCEYKADPAQWRTHMNLIADGLERIGL